MREDSLQSLFVHERALCNALVACGNSLQAVLNRPKSAVDASGLKFDRQACFAFLKRNGHDSLEFEHCCCCHK